jgi:hypothetical protein
MKPNYDKIRSATTLTGERQRMSLDENSLDHLMSVLTDLYSDPEAAIIREYSTNAYDATVDAGSVEPVRITLPTAYAPNFVVQDFGIGMTTDEILHVYSQYGNSTKRESDEVTGMLGVGCKSGLTYTNSFIVTTVKNGVKTVANVTKNTDNIGEIQIIDTSSTNERNGTTVTVPIKSTDIFSFCDKAKTFFRNWQPGTVLVDGKAPEFFLSDLGNFRKVNADVDVYYGTTGNYYSRNVLVMGNVTYPLTISHKMSGYDLVVFAPIGAVNFAPSREELSYRGKTDAYIQTIVDEIDKEIAYIIANAMKDADSKPKAMEIAEELRRARWVPSGTTFTYNGETVPEWPYNSGKIYNAFAWNTGSNWNGNNHRIQRDPWGFQSNRGLIIENAPSNISAAQKAGLVQHFGKDKIILFVNGKVDNEWLTVHDWPTIRKTLPKVATSTTSNGFSVARTGRNYATLNRDGEFTGDYYDENADVNYYAFTPSNRPDKYQFRNIHNYGMIPIQVHKADFDEFVKLDNVWTSIDACRDHFTDNLTDEQIVGLFAAFAYHLPIEAFANSLDEEVKGMVDWSVNRDQWQMIYSYDNKWDDYRVKAAAISDKYPLLFHARYADTEQITEYINAIYTTRNED